MMSYPPTIDLSQVPSSDLAREMSRRSAPGHAAMMVVKPCQYCTLPFGVRGMRAHLHVCTLNPRRNATYSPRRKKDTLPNG